MKHLMTTAAVLALSLSGTVAIPSAAFAQPAGSSDIATTCNGGLAEALGISVGTCVQLLRDGDAVASCKFLKDAGLLDLAGFKNQGECIKTLT